MSIRELELGLLGRRSDEEVRDAATLPRPNYWIGRLRQAEDEVVRQRSVLVFTETADQMVGHTLQWWIDRPDVDAPRAVDYLMTELSRAFQSLKRRLLGKGATEQRARMFQDLEAYQVELYQGLELLRGEASDAAAFYAMVARMRRDEFSDLPQEEGSATIAQDSEEPR